MAGTTLVNALAGKVVVMVVDDDDAVRHVTMRALESFGYETIGAADGFEAGDRFSSEHQYIDCVIIDMSMPGKDGEETFRSLREIDPAVPAVLASGHSVEEMQARFAGLGFAGHLQKPFNLSELNAAVRGIIGTRTSK